MARIAQYDEGEIKAALHMVSEATTIQELRQGQAVLFPALTAATLDTTAEVLGLSRDRECSCSAAHPLGVPGTGRARGSEIENISFIGQTRMATSNAGYQAPQG